MRRHSIAPITAAVLLALAGSAQAATKTTNLKVSANVAANCTVSAANLKFGNYRGTAALKSTSDVSVTCTNGLPYTVALSAGSSTDYTVRKLASGLNSLEYNLYVDLANSAVWGDGSGGTQTVADTGAGMATARTHTVFGTLPNSAANQLAPVGAYSDTIVVSVVY